MANQFINFKYDPSTEGYSNTLWHTVYGDASISDGKLKIDKGLVIHYGDILRGDFSFNVNMSEPDMEDNIRFGLIQYSKNAYIYVSLDDTYLTLETSNGEDSSSISFDWQDEWADTPTDFKIKWGPGCVSLFVNGNLKTSISDSSVPNCPLSLYLYSDSVNDFKVNYITAKAVQSYILSTGNSDSIFEPFVNESERAAVSEDIVMKMDDSPAKASDQSNTTDALTVEIS
jgi:hypothetical protein